MYRQHGLTDLAVAELSRAEIEHGLPWTWREPRVRGAIADPDTNVIVVGRPGAVTAFGLGSGPAAGIAFDGTLLTRPSSGRLM